jgi:hydroxymethylpyrimidine pyrophosphatase-like HAD family hydrolase
MCLSKWRQDTFFSDILYLMTTSIEWNNQLRLSLSDVDETIADVYKPAEPEMINELNSFLGDGGKLFLVTGGGLERVTWGITDFIEPELRQGILVSHCSGAEVWGFNESGELRDKPFYSIYEETFTPELKQLWRDKVDQLIAEFDFHTYPPLPILQFKKEHPDPLDVIFDDRGPQITIELVNAIDLSDEQVEALPHNIPETHGSRDLRVPVLERAEQLFEEAGVPASPRLAGNFALDIAVKGVSKTTSVERVLNDSAVLATIGLKAADIKDVKTLEVWGDKFSAVRGGTDRHISEALPPEVRSIDFREEDPAEFEAGFNVVLWDGSQHLHYGLLQYLQSRSKTH